MPSSTPLPLKHDELVRLSAELAEYLCKDHSGEEFHPAYKAEKDMFRRLIRSQDTAERELKRYFSAVAERVWLKVDWSEYGARLVKASLVPGGADEAWAEDVIELQIILVDALGEAFEVGGISGELEVGVSVGFTRVMPAAQKALRAYTLELAKGITKTTAEMAKQSLLMSLELGEDQQAAIARVNDVIKDPRRSAMIARTESIRAYSQGRLTYAKEAGITHKEWQNGVPGACEICTSNHGKVVRLDAMFPGIGGLVDAPPAHPNCRCRVQLVMNPSGQKK